MENEYGMLPCPFCGEADRLEPIWSHGKSDKASGCRECGATGPRIEYDSEGQAGNVRREDIERVTAAWNKRIGGRRNGYLIAAPPEMYDALYNAASFLSAFSRPDDYPMQEALRNCYKALAKARGDKS